MKGRRKNEEQRTEASERPREVMRNREECEKRREAGRVKNSEERSVKE